MSAEDCCAHVQLYFRAEKLKDTDTLSKSDPFVVLQCCVNKNALGELTYERVGRTETVRDNLNPEFSTSIPIRYFFERKQELLIQVYDEDTADGVDTNNEVIFSKEFTLAQVMSARGHTFTLQDGKSSVTITALSAGDNAKDQVELQLSGRKIKDMDTFSKSDPYYILSRLLPGGRKNLLHRSKTIDDNNDPDWKPCPRFIMSQLTGENPAEVTLEIMLYDEDTTSDDFIGVVQFSFNDLAQSNPDNKTVADHKQLIVRPKLDNCSADHGHIFASVFKVHHKMDFAAHLANGLQINLAVSVDFTGSNGDPHSPDSLHFMNTQQPNEYVRSIMSVGDILMQYDTDKQVPAFGFGARLPMDNKVSHFFHLNLDANPYLNGVQGVLNAYGSTIMKVRLSGPTNFAPSITQVCNGARTAQGVYTVHLILTDGEITDMGETIDAIVAADDAPLSIVVVGVGQGCDFKAMDQLDGDGGKLKNSAGKLSRRDLVQFVPFHRFKNNPNLLAAEVLREVPGQVEQWYDLVAK